jgi:hypothetical protein
MKNKIVNSVEPRIVKPTVLTRYELSKSEIIEILGLDGIFFDYIREGSCKIDRGYKSGTKGMFEADMKAKLLEYLFKNKFIPSIKLPARFETEHYFGSEDEDGNRKSNYSCNFVVTEYKK